MIDAALGSLGRYRLVRRLGRGDVTEAFEARVDGAAGVSKTLCVKRILPAFARDRNFVRVFARQTRSAMALQHGGIAQTLDLGREGKEIFLAMEYVGGESLFRLNRRLARRGLRMPAPLAVHIVLEVCRALEYAHRCSADESSPVGIVHGDVSPRSILLSHEGQVKLVDFGMGRAFRAAEHHAALLSRMAYMPPGMGSEEDAGAWGDVYGAGAVLFDLLAGRPPFDAASIAASLTEEVASPPPLAEVAPWVDAELCEIVDLALALDPRDRTTSAGALEEMLAEYLHSRRERVGEDDVATLLREAFADDESSATGDSQVHLGAYSSLEPAGGPARKRRRPAVMAAIGAGAVSVVAAGVLLGLWIGTPPVETRVVEVRSHPPGARILVDGVETGVSTNGLLRGLPAERVLEIGVVLPGFATQTRYLVPGEAALLFRLQREQVQTLARTEPVARPDPPRSRAGPLQLTLEEGVRHITLQRRGTSLAGRDLPGTSLELDPAAAHTLEITSTIQVALIRPASLLAWVAEDGEGTILGAGNVDGSRSVRIPRGAEKLRVVRLQWGNCDYNVGEARVVVRRGNQVVRRAVVDGNRDCLGISDRIDTTVRELLDEDGLRIHYDGPADGPRLFIGSSSNNPMNLSRSADEGLGSLLPGESMTAYYLVTMHFATFEETADDGQEPLLVRLVPVGPPPAEESTSRGRR